MSDDNKKNRWVRSLDEAGLLDEVEDVWCLPEEPKDGSTIRVEGTLKERNDEKTAVTFNRNVVTRNRDNTERSSVSARIAAADSDAQDEKRDLSRASENESHAVPFATPVSTKAPPPPSGQSVEELTLAEQTWFTDDDERSDTGKEPRAKAKKPSEVTLDLLEADLDIEGHATEMQELYDMGNYSGALKVAEHILGERPGDLRATRVRDHSRETLLHMYEAKIGSFQHIPQLAIDPHEVMWRKLDPATGFVLSRVDGIVTYEDIVDISGLGSFETCRILNQLLQEGIIK